MYETLLPYHSFIRWLVLLALLYSVVSALLGLLGNRPYTKLDNIMRSVTSGLSHVQLLIGMMLYMKSPLVKFFFKDTHQGFKYADITFFSVFHIGMMMTSVVLLTIGAAKARRLTEAADKHKTILIWFGIALIVILLAMPWPFNPFASRPLLRTF
jgi:hypothetical protein